MNKVQLEYAPEPAASYINDQTAFDAFIAYTRPDGSPGFVGIETKLVESFSQKVYSRSGRFMLVYHPLDRVFIQALESYKKLLKPDDRSFSELPLDR